MKQNNYIGSSVSRTRVKRIVQTEWKNLNWMERLRCYWPCILKYIGMEEESIRMIYERLNPGYQLIRNDEGYLVILR